MISKDEFLKIALEQKGNYFDNSERHVRLIESTNGYFLFNGKTEYSILLPSAPTDREKLAAEELRDLFEEATSVRLSIVTEGVDALTDRKYFAIGHTELALKAGVKTSQEELEAQGYFIKNDCQNNVLLVG